MEDQQKAEYLKELGKRVRYYRLKNGWTLEELATRAGYTSETRKTTISKIEGGYSDLPTSKIKSLADAFGIRPSELIDPPLEIREKIKLCDMFARCHGEKIALLVERILKLDSNDRTVVSTMIDSMLSTEKYRQEAKNA